MNRVLYSYALIKTLFDQGEDYIDSFWPFVIKVIPSTIDIDCSTIQSNLKKKYNLEIPLHVLSTIINRAKKKGYINRDNDKYSLTKNGKEYVDKLETEKEIERRINSLVLNIQKYFHENETPITEEEVYNLILTFITRNIGPLIECFNPSASISIPTCNTKTDYEKILIKYLNHIEKNEPDYYKIFQYLVMGSLISTVLYSKDSSQMFEIKERSFKNCTIYLDTNFTFSVLGLHEPEFNEPASELYTLLKNYNFKIRIFGFTVDEICRVLKGYLNEGYRYPTTIGVDTIYSSLKRMGWQKTQVKEFMANIDKIITEKGIKINWIDLDIENYTPKNQYYISAIRKYKPSQSGFHRNHDLASIDLIKKYRRKPIRKIEEAKYIFLSSDVRLSNFNFIEYQHRENSTVCEVVLDRLLTNILWLKNPDTDPPLKSIIAAHSRDLFIKRRIWDQFYKILQKLKQEERISDDNIATLFYQGYIEDVLIDIDESEIDKITPDLVLDEIEKAAKLKEEQSKKFIKEKEEAFLKELGSKVKRKEKEKDLEWYNKLEVIRNRITLKSKKGSKAYASIISSLITITILVVACLLYLLFKKHDISEVYALSVSILFGGSGIFGIWKKLYKYFSQKIFSILRKKKLSDLSLLE